MTEKSPEGYAVQANPMVGSTMVNIRGNSVPEFFENITGVADRAGELTDALTLITAAGQAASAAQGGAASSGPSQANWTPPTQGGGAASQPAGDGHTCAHGQRVYKSGEKNGKAWAAWMCPSSDRANQCRPEWTK